MEMESLVRLIFVLVVMDRIAILVGLSKVGGLPMNLFLLTNRFDNRTWRFPCKRRSV